MRGWTHISIQRNTTAELHRVFINFDITRAIEVKEILKKGVESLKFYHSACPFKIQHLQIISGINT